AGGAGIAPDHRIVAGNAGPALDEAAHHRIARVQVEDGNLPADLRQVQHLRIHTAHAYGVGPATADLQLVLAVGQDDHAALAEHDVEVELAAQALVQLQGMVVEGRTGRIEVVGAGDLSVAAGVAAADPAL